MLQKSKKQIAMALPNGLALDADKIIRVAMTEMRKNPRLAECTPQSFCGAVMQASQLGLEPGGHLGQCYLIPYKSKRSGKLEAQFQLGYKGLLNLHYRSERLKSITARVVYEGDDFNYEYGLQDKLSHRPLEETDNLTHVYAKAEFTNGGYQFVVLTKKQIEKYRKKSKGPNGSFWTEHYEEMAKKTAIIRLSKYIPINTDILHAVEASSSSEISGEQNLESTERFEGVFEADYKHTDSISDINAKIEGAKSE
jgi:recombination protein RecT